MLILLYMYNIKSFYFGYYSQAQVITNQIHFFKLAWLGKNHELPRQPLDMIIQARTDFGNHIFREIFISACWTIWNDRNGFIFDNKATSLADWRAALKEDLGLVCIKAKKSISEPLNLWRENQL